MPYIPPKDRERVIIQGAKNAGELNFFITMAIMDYLKLKGESYQTFNDILGVLSAIPKELYDRKIRQYEDLKFLP